MMLKADGSWHKNVEARRSLRISCFKKRLCAYVRTYYVRTKKQVMLKNFKKMKNYLRMMKTRNMNQEMKKTFH
jgi:hypothetical protein